ncbi:MAG: hypothetical protein HQM13_15975 [SAR324 cluster bacterium]|nr:hypothetical protein [SAR324 cluster bacterium]
MADLVLDSNQEVNVFLKIKQLISEGNRQQALLLLETYSGQNPSASAEWYYRLGNLFFDAQDPDRANSAWEKSVLLREAPASLQQKATDIRSVLWKTIAVTIFVLFSLYTLIVLFFPRQMDLMEMLMLSMQQQTGEQQRERSWWDEFWTTGRQSGRQHSLERDELWSVLNEQMKELMELFSANEESKGSAEDQLVEWLNRFRTKQFLNKPINGKTGYYYLIGRGLFNLRQHEEAIESLKNGLNETIDPRERGVLYQEMATIYYYQGYQLQPDGLAKYDLEMVRKSVDAYQKALDYDLRDPFLLGNLGWGYYLLAEYERAVHYSKQALQMNSQLSYVRMNMGITYLRMHKYQKSFETYQDLFQLAPHAIDYEGGLRDLEELSRDFQNQYPFVHFIIGYIYFNQESYLKAQQALEIFLKLPFPDRTWKQKALQIISKMKNGIVPS